jgi:hypothetical protein
MYSFLAKIFPYGIESVKKRLTIVFLIITLISTINFDTLDAQLYDAVRMTISCLFSDFRLLRNRVHLIDKQLRNREQLCRSKAVNDYTGTKSLCSLEVRVLRKFIII